MTDHVQWLTAAPLWSGAVAASDGAATTLMRQPAILRFATDTFMEDYQRVLDSEPDDLSSYRAMPETWRGPLPTLSTPDPLPPYEQELLRKHRRVGQPSPAQALSLNAVDETTPTLKLYQPAHQRFYLVSACLVCRIAGLPDRVIDAGHHERTTFVVRRLGDAASGEEFAYVTQGASAGWQKISSTQTLASGEEQLPLSGVTFMDPASHRRRLLTGLIPVGKRESYLGAPRLPGSADPPPDPHAPLPPDPRLLQLQVQVTGPWINLLERSSVVNAQLHPDTSLNPDVHAPTGAQANRVRRQAREQAQTGSWYILLDFAHFLKAQVPRVWAALQGSPPADISTAESTLVTTLRGARLGTTLRSDLVAIETDPPAATRSAYQPADIWSSLADALLGILGLESTLESVTDPYNRKTGSGGWPKNLFPLADPERQRAVPIPPVLGIADPQQALVQGVHDLETAISSVLPENPTADTPDIPLAVQPVMDPRGSTQFVIRCVFERPDCGPLCPPLVSDPSAVFLLAGFFDSDAPSRPIRIALPGDITPAGLRKFNKNTAFMISDALCGQLTRIRDHLTLGDLVLSVLPWPFHKDLPSESATAGAPCESGGGDTIGMICTLSLPIITICALIVLFVFVILFDIIFRWLPYFFICFPLPGFKAKSKP